MLRDLRLSLSLFAAAALACSGGNSVNSSSITLAPSPSSAPADGTSTINLAMTAVGADGNPYNGTVNLTSKKSVTYGDGKIQNDSVGMVRGLASQTIVCDPGADCAGTVIVNASLISNGANASAQTQVTFAALPPNPDAGDAGADGGDAGPTPDGGDGGMDAGTPDAGPGLIKFVIQQHPYMGINYETNYVKNPSNSFTFVVTDTTGNIPIPGVRVAVVITTSAQGVAYLEGAFDGGVDGEAVLIPATNAQGQFTVATESGQKAGTVTVIGTVLGPNGAATNISGQTECPVIGTQPSAAKSTLSCSPVNLPVYAAGITGLPCETTAAGTLSTTCTANLADRFGQVVEVPVTVQFYAEAGNFQSVSVTTPDYGATGQGVVAGQAQTVLETSSNLPEDVSPLAIEPSYTDIDPPPSERCGNRTYNPRDGLVTLIAVFNGEEQYTDLTAAGVYAPGDPFTDLPQPFVDNDDSSVYVPGDVCPGSSVANSCAGPNGVWDANSTIFVSTRLLYSGVGIRLPTEVLPQGDTITFSDPGPGGLDIAEMSSMVGSVTWADANLNVGAVVNANPNYNVVASTSPQTVNCTFPAPAALSEPADSLGMSVTFLTECDAGEVPTDAGKVASDVCSLVTQVSEFSGGFTSRYKCTNSNTMAGMGGPVTIAATQQILADQAGNSLPGKSE